MLILHGILLISHRHHCAMNLILIVTGFGFLDISFRRARGKLSGVTQSSLNPDLQVIHQEDLKQQTYNWRCFVSPSREMRENS